MLLNVLVYDENNWNFMFVEGEKPNGLGVKHTPMGVKHTGVGVKHVTMGVKHTGAGVKLSGSLLDFHWCVVVVYLWG